MPIKHNRWEPINKGWGSEDGDTDWTVSINLLRIRASFEFCEYLINAQIFQYNISEQWKNIWNLKKKAFMKVLKSDNAFQIQLSVDEKR